MCEGVCVKVCERAHLGFERGSSQTQVAPVKVSSSSSQECSRRRRRRRTEEEEDGGGPSGEAALPPLPRVPAKVAASKVCRCIMH